MTSEKRTRNVYAVCVVVAIVVAYLTGYFIGVQVEKIRCFDKKIETGK